VNHGFLRDGNFIEKKMREELKAYDGDFEWGESSLRKVKEKLCVRQGRVVGRGNERQRDVLGDWN
jgi:hypothetical protein